MKGVALALLVLGGGCDRTASAAPPPSSEQGAVLVELFTSQGCSSCPPADDLLTTLAADPGVVPLAFHVDYWDELGWPDPYASRRFTRRQRAYADAVQSSRVYTPQLLFDGRDRGVGHSERRARSAIAAAGSEPDPLSLGLGIEMAENSVTVAVVPSTRDLPRPTEIWVALTQDNIVTKVTAGENHGRTLRQNAVVRELALACTIPGNARCRATFPLRGLPRGELSAVAFAQDRRDLTVHTATRRLVE